MNKLSIIIPVWNEEKTLAQLVEKVILVEFDNVKEREIIMINDGSKDKSWEIMQDLAKKYNFVYVYANPQNSGKSQSVRNGILKSTGDLVVVQDADFEYEPQDINSLINLMIEQNLDVVYGNRFGKKNSRGYLSNYLGNLGVSLMSNVFTFPRLRRWIPDMEVCYKLMQGDIAREIAEKLESRSRFGLEPEVTAKLAKYKKKGMHLKFGIVPISYYPRSHAEGKKMKVWESGIATIQEIIKYNL